MLPTSLRSSNNSLLPFGFVVLHYRNILDTIACIQSILKIDYSPGYHIVLVDNASPDDSLGLLRVEFGNNPKVTIIPSTENGGYSKGNNTGIRALLSMGIEKIIIATNDTEIISQNLLHEFNLLNTSKVGAMGPCIITREGVLQNPPYSAPTFLYILNLYLYELMIIVRGWIYKMSPASQASRAIAVTKQKLKFINPSNEMSASSVYMLHGSFIFLTQNYINKIGLLDEALFMYGEEDLIAWNCEKYQLERIFLPQVRILHKDALSTKVSFQEKKDAFVINQAKISNQYLRVRIRLLPLLKIWFLWKSRVRKV